MTTDAQHPAPSGPKGWWTTIVWSELALVLSCALPAGVVVLSVCDYFHCLPHFIAPDSVLMLTLLCPVIAIACGVMAKNNEGSRRGIVGCFAMAFAAVQLIVAISLLLPSSPGEVGNPPLMAERCVEDGMFTPGEKPVFKRCAHILLANGTVKTVSADKGKLVLGDIKLEDLEKLK